MWEIVKLQNQIIFLSILDWIRKFDLHFDGKMLDFVKVILHTSFFLKASNELIWYFLMSVRVNYVNGKFLWEFYEYYVLYIKLMWECFSDIYFASRKFVFLTSKIWIPQVAFLEKILVHPKWKDFLCKVNSLFWRVKFFPPKKKEKFGGKKITLQKSEFEFSRLWVVEITWVRDYVTISRGQPKICIILTQIYWKRDKRYTQNLTRWHESCQ